MISQIRFRRPRRREMTPSRAICVYALAFLLAAWHQSGRVAEWFENQALERDGRLSETVLFLAGFLKEEVWPRGPAQLNSLEDRMLAWLSREAETGAVRTPPPPQPEPEASEAEEPEPQEEVRPPEPPPQAGPVWPDPEADPALWLSQVNPDEQLPEAVPEISALDPEPAPPEETAPPPPATPSFKKVLLLGDSMMLEGLGPQLQKELRRQHENLAVDRDGRYGTGLTRLDYFDWLDFFERMLVKYSPELVILTVGANDPQDILEPEGPPGRRRILVGTADWNELYAARVLKLLKLAEDRGVQVFWVGLPIMGREPYGSRVANINAVASASCAEAPNCRFWDSWLSVADARGRFISYALDEKGRRLRLRGRDAIHLTEEGGLIMARKFLAATKDWADYQAAEPAEPPAAAEKTAEKTGTARPPEEPAAAPLTRLGVPPLPPQRPRPQPGPAEPPADEPQADAPSAAEPQETRPAEEPAAPALADEPPAPEAPPDEPQATPDPEPAPPGPEEPEEDEEIEFVDPLPVDEFVEPPPLRLAPSTGDGSAEDFLISEYEGSAMEPAHFPPAPSAGGAADWSEGRFYSPALGRETVLRLASPRPGPGRPGPFPVVLLLHGAWESAWERELETLLALADRLALMLALPEGPAFSWYLDGPETAMETFLLADFLPELFKKPAADQARLAVAGLSMGGHGALTLALKRPDLFQAAGALSAVTDLAAHAGNAHKVDPELAIHRVLGPAGPEGRNWQAFGAAGLWEARGPAWQGRPLFLGVGSDDKLTLAENRAFTRQLARLGLDHVYEEKPGGHDWGYWSAQLPAMLEFISGALGPRTP